MSAVFVSGTALALGPWVAPALILIFALLVGLVLWLLRKPNLWRVSMACLIVAFIALQLAPLVVG